MGSGARYLHPVSGRRMLVEGPCHSAVPMVASGASGGRLSLAEHPLAPRALGSTIHTHSQLPPVGRRLDQPMDVAPCPEEGSLIDPATVRPGQRVVW